MKLLGGKQVLQGGCVWIEDVDLSEQAIPERQWLYMTDFKKCPKNKPPAKTRG